MPMALLLSGSIASAALTLKYTFEDITGNTVPNTAPGATINGTLVTGNGGLSCIVETGPNVVVDGVTYPLGKVVRFGNQGGYNDGWGDADAPHINTNALQSLWGVSGTTQYTAMAWVRFYNQNGDNMVFGNNAGGGRLHLGSRDSRYWSGHWGDDVEGTNIATDTANWHHVAWTNDASNNQQIYLDGVQMTGTAGAGIAGNNPGALEAVNLIIGSSGNGGSFNGAVDDVKVFDTRLTTAEIQAQRTATLFIAGADITVASAAPSTSGDNFRATFILKDGVSPGRQVNPATITSVNFDGAPGTIVGTPTKTGDQTTVVAQLTGPYIPGQHVYNVHVLGTDAGAAAYDLAKAVTGPVMPPVASIPGAFGATAALPWGVREYSTTAADGNAAVGIILTNAGPSVDGDRAVINFSDPEAPGDRGDFNNEILSPGNTAGDDNHVIVGKMQLAIPAAGNYSFNIRTDDGSGLKINGATCVAPFAVAIDPADASFVLGTGVTNGRATYSFPSAGTYDVAFMSFDSGGGGSMEIAWAPGTLTANDERELPWTLLGNPAHASVPPTTSVYPANLPGLAGTNGMWGIRTYRTAGYENVNDLSQTIAFLSSPAVIGWTPGHPMVSTTRTGWNHAGYDPGGTPTSDTLTAPDAVIPATPGSAQLTLVHRHNFEADTVNWDGGAVQYSINGGAFLDLPAAAFTQNGYNGTVGGSGPLNGKQGFIGASAGFGNPSYITSLATIPGVNPGDEIQVRLIGAWDEFYTPGGTDWEISRIRVAWGATTVYDSALTPTHDGGLVGNVGGIWTFDAGGAVTTRTEVIDTLSAELNYKDPTTNGEVGVLMNAKPFPGDTPADDQRVVTVAHARITIATAGDYTFNEHSDDGFLLRVKAVTGPNPVFKRVSGGGGRTMSAPNEMYFTVGTGDADTRGIMFLEAGQYDLDFVNWEGEGGFFYQLSIAAGAFPNNGDTNDWVPVGHQAAPVALSQPTMESPWDVQTSNPGALVGGTAPLIPASEGTPLNSAIQYPAINFADPQAGSASSFGGDVPFSNDTGGDDNQFVVKATGYLHIVQEGDYLIGYRGDDGGYFTLFGGPAAGFSRIVENATGAGAIVDSGGTRNRIATDVATGDSLTSAIVHLTPDDYPVTTLFYEIGGGASYEVFGSAVSGASLTPARGMNRILLRSDLGTVPTFTPDTISSPALTAFPVNDLSAGYVNFSFGAGDNYSVTFPSTPGLGYALEYSMDLVNWRVAGNTYGGAGASTTVSGQLSNLNPPVPSDAARIYWRVRGAY